MMISNAFTLKTILCLSIATLFGCGSSGSDSSNELTDDKATQATTVSSATESVNTENEIVIVDDNNAVISEQDDINDQIISLPSVDDITSDFLTSENDVSQDVSSDEPMTVDEVNIQISWTDNSDNEIEFIIERRSADDVDYGTTYYAEENTTSFEDLQVSTGETYCYRVSASNNYGMSPSSEVCVDL
jgi:hypothetical protein